MPPNSIQHQGPLCENLDDVDKIYQACTIQCLVAYHLPLLPGAPFHTLYSVHFTSFLLPKHLNIYFFRIKLKIFQVLFLADRFCLPFQLCEDNES